MKNDLNIYKSKVLADGAKYFSLFEKHIPELKDGSNVYLYAISNLACICDIIQKNPKAKYFIYDEDEIVDAISIVMDNCDISKTVDVYDIDMKFDCVIMNPPYQKNLHLKILAEAIKHLKDDNSRVVNLSPVRWLQDPLAKYKKNSDYHRFEETIRKHLTNIDVVIAHDAQQCFSGSVINMDLAVYLCEKSSENKFNIDDIQDSIAKKVAEFTTKTTIKFDFNKKDGYRIRMPLIVGGKSGGSGDRDIGLNCLGKLLYFYNGKTIDGTKWWYECYRTNQYSKTTDEITMSLKVDSELIAQNFINQFNTNFCKYTVDKLLSDVHVAPNKIIWMGDAINPRTGLKGYESAWTDEDFFKFFNITDDEKKIIEETMSKYAK